MQCPRNSYANRAWQDGDQFRTKPVEDGIPPRSTSPQIIIMKLDKWMSQSHHPEHISSLKEIRQRTCRHTKYMKSFYTRLVAPPNSPVQRLLNSNTKIIFLTTVSWPCGQHNAIYGCAWLERLQYAVQEDMVCYMWPVTVCYMWPTELSCVHT